MISVALAAAIVFVVAAAWLAIDWERLHARVRRRRRRGYLPPPGGNR